jgi:hypothetical protein
VTLWTLVTLGGCLGVSEGAPTPAAADRARTWLDAGQCADREQWLFEIAGAQQAIVEAVEVTGEMEGVILEMHAAALSAVSELTSDADRAALDATYQDGLADLEALAAGPSYGGVGLLIGTTGAPTVAVDDDSGLDVALPLADLTTAALSIDGEDLSTDSDAHYAAVYLYSARQDVLDARAALVTAGEVLGDNAARLDRDRVRCGLAPAECLAVPTPQCDLEEIDPALALLQTGLDTLDTVDAALEGLEALAGSGAEPDRTPEEHAAYDEDFHALLDTLPDLFDAHDDGGRGVISGGDDFGVPVWTYERGDSMIRVRLVELTADDLGLDGSYSLETDGGSEEALAAVQDARSVLAGARRELNYSALRLALRADLIERFGALEVPE